MMFVYYLYTYYNYSSINGSLGEFYNIEYLSRNICISVIIVHGHDIIISI